MLSRVAENLYWLARYLERAENTARLIRSYNHLIMDIPKGSEPSWMILVDILDARREYEERYQQPSELNVHKFLVTGGNATSSVRFSINLARDDLRITRDVLPEEAWEQVNELQLLADEHARASTSRGNRLIFLDQVIHQCQALTGLLQTTAPRDHAYRFMTLGRMIERADMTARIVDVGAGDIIDRGNAFAGVEPILWGALLEALSGRSAYRRVMGPIVEQSPMISFVFKESTFPRSLLFCNDIVRRELKRLPKHKNAVTQADKIRRRLQRFNNMNEDRTRLHKFIDTLQVDIIRLNAEIAEAWFIQPR
jgi:uncharacterized alpha-E superfamily protein